MFLRLQIKQISGIADSTIPLERIEPEIFVFNLERGFKASGQLVMLSIGIPASWCGS